MSTLAQVEARVALIWWRTVIAHRPVENQDGDLVCPICQVRKCHPRADAFANLIATDRYHLGPPPTLDRP